MLKDTVPSNSFKAFIESVQFIKKKKKKGIVLCLLILCALKQEYLFIL